MAREKTPLPYPNPQHTLFWLQFLVLAADEPQLSKGLLVPVAPWVTPGQRISLTRTPCEGLINHGYMEFPVLGRDTIPL